MKTILYFIYIYYASDAWLLLVSTPSSHGFRTESICQKCSLLQQLIKLVFIISSQNARFSILIVVTILTINAKGVIKNLSVNIWGGDNVLPFEDYVYKNMLCRRG